jgi:hypothetical protein
MELMNIQESFSRLKDYVERENFKGWDPYDGLNSKFFQRLPISKSSLARLAWIQFFKRSQINFRPIFQVEKGFNSKGLGLFLSGYCNLYRLDPREEYKQKIFFLANQIKELKSAGYSGACWGYNFDWQARAFFQPKHTPTVVATTYVSYSLLDAYDLFHHEEWLKSARSSCDFILNDLNRTYDEAGDFCFSYSPLDKTQVFNASLLGSRLLSRVYAYTREEKLAEAAKKSVSFCCKQQKTDGSWSYGTLPFHQWIDNFHTGFNLECISEFQKYTGDGSYNDNLKRGMGYYLTTFFTEDGRSKYYNTALYPIDIHSPAQLIVTLGRMGKMAEHQELLNRVLTWTQDHMQDSRGYFYYQVKKMGSSKIPYMRWAQAWMFFGLSYYLTNTDKG